MIEPTQKQVFPSVNPPVPYGAWVTPSGVQFSIFSRHATHVWILLFDQPDAAKPIEEIELDPFANRLGDVWHIHLPQARAGMFYVYRMAGRRSTTKGRLFNPEQWLLDPYALAISGRPKWGDPGHLERGEYPVSGPAFPKGVILDDTFDWSQDVTPTIPNNDAVIYEAHLRGFTANANAGVSAPGTYRGFIEKIPYLVDLGITSVELLPIHEFNEMEYYTEDGPRRDLRNYWGYSTLAFFAPNGRYAQGGVCGQQVREFKELVLALHQAGLEIILDVVFNHTAEGGRGGPIHSFRGVDNSIYYMMEKDGRHYRNYSGCGNTVNCNQPVVRNFILNCLRYWVREMRIDGFRFDLATVMTRGTNGDILNDPPLIEAITEDPVLRHTKLIAEAWDASGGYQVGSFPSSHWAEWNGKYRDDIRRFWMGEQGLLGTFARRITGSADLYDRNDQSPLKSVNFVTCHDGFTLSDLVSYSHKHNEANGEKNRDGEKHNHCFNFGEEGHTDNPKILHARNRQMKNFIATLLLSQGVPMLLAGDEFGNAQGGNNNAYCQDSELSWLDWDQFAKHQDLHQFTKRAIAFRRRHPGLRRLKFFHGDKGDGSAPDITWFGPDGQTPDWGHGIALGCMLSGAREHTGSRHTDDTLILIFNASEHAVDFRIPVAPGGPWRIILTTEEKRPAWQTSQQTIGIDGRAVLVLASAVTA